MIEAVPAGWLTSDYRVFHAGSELTRLAMAWDRDACRYEVDGRLYEARRSGFAGLVGAYELVEEGQTVATVRRPNPFSRRYEVIPTAADDTRSGHLTLVAVSAFSRKFRVDRSSATIGVIRPVSLFSGRAVVDLPNEVPAAMQLFLLWLVITSWRQGNTASSG